MGLDVALVHRRRVNLGLGGDGGLLEAPGQVAELVAHVRGDVAAAARVLAELLGRHVLVQHRRVVAHGVEDVHRRRQHLVVYLDQGQGFLGGVQGGGRHGRHGMAAVERLVGGEHVVAHVLDARRALAEVDDLVVRGRSRQVGAGDDGAHAGHLRGAAGVDGTDAGVGVRRAEHLPVEQSRKAHVAAVDGSARDLVGAVVADRTRADHVVLPVAEIADLAVAVSHGSFPRLPGRQQAAPDPPGDPAPVQSL